MEFIVTILVTGSAGFIGFHLSKALLERGDNVIGIDNLNDYYDVNLKKSRLQILEIYKNFTFNRLDISDKEKLFDVFKKNNINRVVNLAAQAGVRYSIENPDAYIESNIVGFINILEACRHNKIEHLVYASSSSVYGANKTFPFSESNNIDHPMSLYAATKKSNELMAHSYASLYDLPCTGLRFFTVYGPWGRPDMALFKFAKNILNNESIDVYNNGEMIRDFTYVDDIVEGIIRALDKVPQGDASWRGEQPDPATSYALYKIYNIGNGYPEPLMKFVHAIEASLDKKAIINYMPLQPGDVPKTSANIARLNDELGYTPKVRIEEGIKKFIEWYVQYYKPQPQQSL